MAEPDARAGRDRTGQVALVTGGGRGIGRATALALAAAGCDVAVLARTPAEVEAVAAEIARAGRRGFAVMADLADLGAIVPTVDRVRDRLGPVSILVNNAATAEPLGPSLQVDPAEWARALTSNLSSVFALISATLPDMLQAGWGRVVSVSSGVASGNGMINANAYSTSKAGLEMLTRNLAAELAEAGAAGITVNAVRPGTVDTAMQGHIRGQPADRVGQAMYDRFANFYESGALLPPEVPARLILAVIAGQMTGEVISVSDERGRALLSQALQSGA